jgi:hypothetical protein
LELYKLSTLPSLNLSYLFIDSAIWNAEGFSDEGSVLPESQMRSHLLKVVRRSDGSKGRSRATLRTLTLLVPRSYNPDARGIRIRVELSKLVRTFREMRRMFDGYSVQDTKGWYRDSKTGKEVRDHHFRIEVDLSVTPSVARTLRIWKKVLEVRFDQRAIYMRLSDRSFWL